MAIEVTEEMRRAVYEADCQRLGHLFNLRNAMGIVDEINGTPAADVRGPNPETLPHLSCNRCPKVWLVIEQPGEDYADAVVQLKDRFKNPDDVAPLPRPVEAAPRVMAKTP